MFKTKNVIGFFFAALIFGFSVSFVDAARLYLSPTTETFIYNCPFDVDVMLDMEGEDTTAMDLKMLVDESRFTIMNFDGQGGLFRTYTKPKYLTVRRGGYAGIDTVYVFFSTFTPPVGVEGAGKLGTLTIKPHPGVWEANVGFYFEPGDKTEDTNIPVMRDGKLVDGLNSVENGFYKFEVGECVYGASENEVQMGGVFELVKNEEMEDEPVVSIIPQIGEDTSNLIKQYGRYIILLIVIIALIIIWRRSRKDDKK